MNTTTFGIRLTDEQKERLQADALSRGISMAALVKERLATGRTLPPHISAMVDRYAHFIGVPHEDVFKRIVVWHFAMLEVGIELTGAPDALLAQAPFVRFDRELSDRELFEYAAGTITKELKRRETLKQAPVVERAEAKA